MKVAISSGHSKKSPGILCSFTNQYEYFYTNALSALLYNHLIAMHLDVYSPDHVADLLPYPDHLLVAVDCINDFDPVLAVELHFNAFSNPSVRGCETVYGKDNSMNLARILQTEICNMFDMVDRGLKKYESKYFLVEVNCPAVITEPLFLTNEDDIKYLTSEWFLEELAYAHAIAIKEYINREAQGG